MHEPLKDAGMAALLVCHRLAWQLVQEGQGQPPQVLLQQLLFVPSQLPAAKLPGLHGHLQLPSARPASHGHLCMAFLC